nr:flagellar assembly protein FliW [Bacillus marinisedimentorum]
MKVETRYHGTVEAAEQDNITFPNGLPGFSDEHEFLILPFGDDSPFFILQSVKTAGLAFVMAVPFQFFPEYEFNLSEEVTEKLEIDSENDVAVFVILTVQEPFEKTTANLQGPVVINQKKQVGRQLVLNEKGYETRHLLFGKNPAAGQEG